MHKEQQKVGPSSLPHQQLSSKTTSSQVSSSSAKLLKNEHEEIRHNHLEHNFDIPIQPMVNEIGRAFFVCPCGTFLRTTHDGTDIESESNQINEHLNDSSSETHVEFLKKLSIR